MLIIFHFTCSMFHNGIKSKPLNSWFYWCRPVFVIINTINFLFFRWFIHISRHISFILCSINIQFPFLKKYWMVDFLGFWRNICIKYGAYLFFFSIELSSWIGWMIIWIDYQVFQCIWSGRYGCKTYHD